MAATRPRPKHTPKQSYKEEKDSPFGESNYFRRKTGISLVDVCVCVCKSLNVTLVHGRKKLVCTTAEDLLQEYLKETA